MNNDGSLALVLSGGGARAAYQVGAARGSQAEDPATLQRLERSILKRPAEPPQDSP